MSQISLRNTGGRESTEQSREHTDDVNKAKEANEGNVTEVPRTIGLFGGISFIVGVIIGSGIFIAPKGIAEGSGSVGLCLINWAICGIISMLAALCYAELGTVIKESGADYAFLHRGYGPAISFMMSWVFVVLLKPATLATLTITCSQYVLTLLFDDGCGPPPMYIVRILALFVLMIISSINIYSSTLGTRIQIIFTSAKLLALAVIIVGGIVKLFQGYTEHLQSGFEGTESNPGKIAVGLYSGMFAYDGWNAANFITEEIQNPERNLPLAIVIGVPIVIVVYILTNISYFTVMSIQELIDSNAVAITWAERVIPSATWLIPLFVAMSTFGSGNGSMFTTGRLIFVSARNEHLPNMFNMVHYHKLTPVPACILLTVLGGILIFIGNVSSLITYLSFIKWIFYGMNAAALISFRYRLKYKNIDRPIKVPLVIPVIVIMASIFIVIVPIATDPQIEFLYAAIFMIAGLIFYVPLVYYKYHFRFMDTVTTYGQMSLQICQPIREKD